MYLLQRITSISAPSSFSSQTAANNCTIWYWWLKHTEFGFSFGSFGFPVNNMRVCHVTGLKPGETTETERGSPVCSGPSLLSLSPYAQLRAPAAMWEYEQLLLYTHTTRCSSRKISLQLLRDSSSFPGRCLMRGDVLIPFVSQLCSMWWWTAPPSEPRTFEKLITWPLAPSRGLC